MKRAVVALLDPFDGRVELVVDALAQRDLDQAVDDLLVVVPEHDVGAVDQRHVASELVEDAGELIGDIAAADDHDPLGQLVEVERFVRADRVLDPVEPGHHRPSARGDQDLAGGEFLAIREPHLGRPDNLGALLEDLHVVVGEGLGIGPFQAADLRQDIVAQHRPVEPLGRHVPAEHRGVLEVLGEMRAIDQQLLGDAAADHTGPADFMLLGDRDLGAVGGGDARCPHPARSGADHEQVEVGHQIPALSISARVEASSASSPSPPDNCRAISLPSSTPNWSKGLIPSSTALAKVRCS